MAFRLLAFLALARAVKVGGTPAELTAVMRSESQRWSKVIREAPVKAD